MSDLLRTLFGLQNRVVVLIGGGGHICSAISTAFAVAGAKVVVADLREGKAQEVATRLTEKGATATPMHVDATSSRSLQECCNTTLEMYGSVDVLVNGAGTNSPQPIFGISLEDWNAVVESQLTATLLGCQVFGRVMLDQHRGSIINISSASAGPPLSRAFAYSAAKAAIVNLTQNLAREWAPYGVRVNALRPGFFPTEWNRKNFLDPERVAKILDHTPMARFGEVEELQGAALFLAGDGSEFVTGSEVCVDGGFSAMTI